MMYHVLQFKVGIFLLSLLCFHLVKVHAQQLAVADKTSHWATQDEKLISLEAALKELETKLDISLNYDYKTIENKFVKAEQLNKLNEDVEKSLSAILNPLQLKYEKIAEHYYIIFEKNSEKSIQKIENNSLDEVNYLQRKDLSAWVKQMDQRYLETTITGRVTDEENGEGLPGVNILVKGTTTGTVTDLDGKYRINVPDGYDVLVFSSIGYVTQEVPIGNQTTLNIALTEDIQSLSEIVVVGYGTQEKKEITSAVTNVTPEEFNKGNITDVAQLMQGKVAGLSVTRAGGDPNNGYTIRLRGLSSLGTSTEPLVVIDGQIGADLNSVDPNDIQSIDILKDGSAAAIYGTRGSAGVILITTKTGVKDAAQVDYNGYVSMESPARLIPVMSAGEFRELGIGNDRGAGTDWYDEISRTGVSHTHNLSLSGSAGSGTSYRASLNFRDIQGIAIETGFERLNGRLTLQQRALDDRLTVNLNLASTWSQSDLGWNDAFKYAAIFNPTAPVRTTDPLFDLTGGGYFEENFVDYANPVAVLRQNTNEQIEKRTNFLISAEYELIDGLRFLARYAQEVGNTYHSIYLPKNAFYLPTLEVTGRAFNGFARSGYAVKEDDETSDQLVETILTYETIVGNIDLSALAGYSYQDFLNQGIEMAGGGFLTDKTSEKFSSASDFDRGMGRVDSYKNANRLVGFFGRVNLNYDNTYFLSASIRREGSTMFGELNKWGNFPAISAGVDLSRIAAIPLVDNLKLRASYGITGALPPDPYLSLQTLSAGDALFYAGNAGYITSFGPERNPNPNLRWEKKEEFDIGLDFVMLDNRLTGTIDYYNRTTRDLIFEAQVPVPPNLVPTTWLNIGTLESDGFELALSYDAIQNADFNWNTSVNFTTYKITLAELEADEGSASIPPANLGTPGQEATQVARAIPGEEIGILWGLTFDRIDEDGKYVFRDLNGDGNIDTNDQGQVGKGLPDFEFGWNNSFTYKNWDLNFFFRGAIGHDLVNSYRGFYENPNVATSYNVVKTKYYNPALDDAQIFSSLHVEGASFVELDNATLGYSVNLPGESFFRNLRLYLSGQNLFMITDYTGPDPEVRYQDRSLQDGRYTNVVLTPGIDRRETWVWSRTFTFGVNVGF